MIMQDQKKMIDKASDETNYEKPALVIKYFLLESNITILSNINPTNGGENTLPSEDPGWWD